MFRRLATIHQHYRHTDTQPIDKPNPYHYRLNTKIRSHLLVFPARLNLFTKLIYSKLPNCRRHESVCQWRHFTLSNFDMNIFQVKSLVLSFDIIKTCKIFV